MQEKIDFIFDLKIKGEKSKTSLKQEYKARFASDKDFSKIEKIVDEQLAEYFKNKIEDLAPEIAVHYWDLYAKSYKLQDYRECRAILKDLKDLTLGFEQSKKGEIQERPASKLMTMRKKTG